MGVAAHLSCSDLWILLPLQDREQTRRWVAILVTLVFSRHVVSHAVSCCALILCLGLASAFGLLVL